MHVRDDSVTRVLTRFTTNYTILANCSFGLVVLWSYDAKLRGERGLSVEVRHEIG